MGHMFPVPGTPGLGWGCFCVDQRRAGFGWPCKLQEGPSWGIPDLGPSRALINQGPWVRFAYSVP